MTMMWGSVRSEPTWIRTNQYIIRSRCLGNCRVIAIYRISTRCTASSLYRIQRTSNEKDRSHVIKTTNQTKNERKNASPYAPCRRSFPSHQIFPDFNRKHQKNRIMEEVKERSKEKWRKESWQCKQNRMWLIPGDVNRTYRTMFTGLFGVSGQRTAQQNIYGGNDLI